MAIATIIVRAESPGPIIYSQARVGENNIEFNVYKFRSMRNDAEKDGAKWATLNDPRVTKFGNFMRKTRIDELPQLWNVLVGDMSLVGPRPIIDAEVEKYGIYIDDFYMVRPGITGLWQVSGRSDTTYEERVQMDSWYVRNWSVWLDLIYLLRTVSIVLLRKGAY